MSSFIRETCRFCPSSMRKFEIGSLKWSESRDAASFRLRLVVDIFLKFLIFFLIFLSL